MEIKNLVVVCSERPAMLRLSLVCVSRQTLPFTRIVVVAWGPEAPLVVDEASRFSPVEVVRAGKAGTVSAHRNLALDRVHALKPEYVIFLDDDTFLSDTWHECVMRTSVYTKTACSVGGMTTFTSHPHTVQSVGHVFSNYRPLDVAYGLATEDSAVVPIPSSEGEGAESFSCPCANSALVPWVALERIYEIDGRYWDERFPRLTCFELGFKLHRLGYGYILAPGALATHDGYLHRKNLRREDVYDQIFSRIMLYRKFLPAGECIHALTNLGQRVTRWATRTYPHSRIGGDAIIQMYIAALKAAEVRTFDRIWTKQIPKLSTG